MNASIVSVSIFETILSFENLSFKEKSPDKNTKAYSSYIGCQQTFKIVTASSLIT